jgi:hypothetical protein
MRTFEEVYERQTMNRSFDGVWNQQANRGFDNAWNQQTNRGFEQAWRQPLVGPQMVELVGQRIGPPTQFMGFVGQPFVGQPFVGQMNQQNQINQQEALLAQATRRFEQIEINQRRNHTGLIGQINEYRQTLDAMNDAYIANQNRAIERAAEQRAAEQAQRRAGIRGHLPEYNREIASQYELQREQEQFNDAFYYDDRNAEEQIDTSDYYHDQNTEEQDQMNDAYCNVEEHEIPNSVQEQEQEQEEEHAQQQSQQQATEQDVQRLLANIRNFDRNSSFELIMGMIEGESYVISPLFNEEQQQRLYNAMLEMAVKNCNYAVFDLMTYHADFKTIDIEHLRNLYNNSHGVKRLKYKQMLSIVEKTELDITDELAEIKSLGIGEMELYRDYERLASIFDPESRDTAIVAEFESSPVPERTHTYDMNNINAWIYRGHPLYRDLQEAHRVIGRIEDHTAYLGRIVNSDPTNQELRDAWNNSFALAREANVAADQIYTKLVDARRERHDFTPFVNHPLVPDLRIANQRMDELREIVDRLNDQLIEDPQNVDLYYEWRRYNEQVIEATHRVKLLFLKITGVVI